MYFCNLYITSLVTMGVQSIYQHRAMPWLKQLIGWLSTAVAWVRARAEHVRFVVDEVAGFL
jgi:hypothetical protein